MIARIKKLSPAVAIVAGVTLSTGLLAPSAFALDLSPAPSASESLVSLSEVDIQGQNYQVNVDETISDKYGPIASFPTANVEYLLNTPDGAKAGDVRTIEVPEMSFSYTVLESPEWDQSQVLTGEIKDANGNVAATISWDMSNTQTSDGYIKATITYTDWVEQTGNTDLLLKIPYGSARSDHDDYNIRFKIDGNEHIIENYFQPHYIADASDYGIINQYYSGTGMNNFQVISPIMHESDMGGTATFSHEIVSENNIFQFDDESVSFTDGYMYHDGGLGNYTFVSKVGDRGDVTTSSSVTNLNANYTFTIPPYNVTRADQTSTISLGGVAGDFTMLSQVFSSETGMGITTTSSSPYQWEDNTYTVSNVFNINGNITDSSQKFAGNAITARAYGTPAPVSENDSIVTDFNMPIDVHILDNDTSNTGFKQVFFIDQDGNRVDSLTTAQGTWTVNAEGVVNFDPADGFTGAVDPVQYVIVDGNNIESNVATVSASVNAAIAPESSDDTVAAKENTPIVIPVLDNDTLNQTGAEWSTVELIDPVTGERVTQVETDKGVFAVNEDNTITFTPADGFTGVAPVIEYVATDSNGKESSSTINVEVEEFSTAVVNQDNVTVDESGEVVIPVLDNDELTEDGATWDKVELIDPITGKRVTTVTTDAGTFTVNSDNTITFTPAEGFTGTAPVIEYVATDSNGKESSSTINVEVEEVDDTPEPTPEPTDPGEPTPEPTTPVVTPTPEPTAPVVKDPVVTPDPVTKSPVIVSTPQATAKPKQDSVVVNTGETAPNTPWEALGAAMLALGAIIPSAMRRKK